jgi:stearoyl-CoA desaturase (delta-9 desaturase)
MDFSMKMWRDIPGLVAYHYKEGNINWPMGIYISLVHVVAVTGLFYLPKCSYETLIWAFFLWPISGFGITVGVHRLWSHRSYEASFIVRAFLMLCNSVANQGSIFHWSRDHRVHHKYTETDADPHNATRGFFFAHMGWLFIKKHEDVVKAGREMDFSDLKEDSCVMFQKRLDPWFTLYMCFVMPAQVASYFWGEDFWNAFFVAGCLRYCIVLHFTWLVNSAAHLYGDHPYDVLSYPAENPIVSWCSVGEGWHNWHHKYPFDYAASEFGISSQFNPSKLFIDVLAAVGLVWGRKRGTAAWAMGRARRDRDRANGVPLPKPPVRPWEVDTSIKKMD